jgi:hypothetical protein
VAVGSRGRSGEVAHVDDLAGEVRVSGVDAGVEDRNGAAGAVVVLRPRGRRADLGHAVLKGCLNFFVQPDLVDPGEEARVRRHGASEGRSFRLGLPRGDSADAFEGVHPCQSGRQGGRHALVVHDQRQRLARPVAQALGGELADIEELPVELLVEMANDIGGKDVKVAGDLTGLERGLGPMVSAGCWIHRGRLAAIGEHVQVDAVTSDERQLVGTRARRRARRRNHRRPPKAHGRRISTRVRGADARQQQHR